MDDSVELDVEDLFNGEGGLDEGTLDDILPNADHPALQPQTVAPPAAVVERILNLSHCGCLRRIAWSSQGHVTAISEDGSSVTVQCLRMIPGTSRWRLTTPKRLNHVFEDAISLLWSASGVDLAVIDSKGRVYIYTFTTISLNILDPTKDNLTVPAEEQSPPVLSFWLNSERPDRAPRSVVLNATKTNDKWTQNLGKAKSFGPNFPRAFLMVTKNCTLSLIYQRHDGQHRRYSVQLPISSRTTLVHGAVAATMEGNLLLALYTFDKKLILYRLHIQWPAEWKVNPADPAHPKVVTELINADIPMALPTIGTDETAVGELYHTEDTIITHLNILPTSDIENSEQMSPQIWAVFALVNHNINAAEPGFLQSSFIRRWSVAATQRKLHPKFDELPTKSDIQTANQDILSVASLPVTQFPQIITNIELIENGQMVMITTIDGQVEVWNPVSMTPASFDSDPNQVTSLSQSGFSFSPPPASVIVTLSPNASSFITQRADQSRSLGQAMYLGLPSKGLEISDPQQSAATSALVLAFVRACFSSSNSDDVLSCMNLAYQRENKASLLTRLYSIMFHPVEFLHEKAPNSQLERSIANRLAQKALSLQLAFYASEAALSLQPNGFPHPSTWARLWAWITLNLRYVSLSLSLLHKEILASQQTSQPAVLAPSYIESMCNMIKWTIDLYRFICETILEVGDRQSNPDMFDDPASSPNFNLGDEKGDGSQGLVALLLNCNWSRIALWSTAKPIFYFVSKADATNPHIRQLGDVIRRYSTGKGLSLFAAEMLFNGRWYSRSGWGEQEQYDSNLIAARQIEMMTTGVVGQYYQNTVQDLLNKVINHEQGLRYKQPAQFSRLKLFTETPEVSWLLLNMDQYIPSPTSAESNLSASAPRKLYDAHKKAPILVKDQPKIRSDPRSAIAQSSNSMEDPVQMVRRCIRCGSLSEDVEGLRPDWPKVLTTFYSRCVCDGNWVVEPLITDEIKFDKDNPLQNKENGMLNVKIDDATLKTTQ